MAIIQCNFSVPDETMRKLEIGEYFRKGGVIRDSAGHIVEILKDVPNRNNMKYGLIGVGLFVAGSLTATAIIKYQEYKKKKKEKQTQSFEEMIAVDHNEIITDYINAISSGTLNIDLLKEFIKNLKFIYEESQNKGLEIKINIEKTNELFELLYKYTLDLAKLNNIDLDLETLKEERSLLNTIKILEYQQTIFEKDMEKELVEVEVNK